MKTVQVNASGSYDVLIGSGLMEQTGSQLRRLGNWNKIAILSDSNVWPLYGQTLARSLSDAGFNFVHYVFPAGEANKNGQTYLSFLEFLAENQLTRSDLIVALGGGVTGDLAGFAAATYLRGIDYVQIPTSLLAMVDSSVGGKTAIDLSAGKNLAGAFYQPRLVLCDIDSLKTLPDVYFMDGCAEILKYAILYDPQLFDHLMEHGPEFSREEVIFRCVRWKKEAVCADEFDRGQRQLLNLGHTIGHSIEKCSNYTVSHGLAVAQGIAMIARSCASFGICSREVCGKIIALLRRFSLPTQCSYCEEDLFQNALQDKKRSANSVNLILIHAIGSCLPKSVDLYQLREFIKAGL